jgi:hypothetical protein
MDALYLSNTYRAMATLYRRSGHLDLASALEEKSLELWRQWNRKFPNKPFVLRQLTPPQASRLRR